MKYIISLLVLLVLLLHDVAAQTDTYILNGSAHQDKCNCYTLTPESGNQSGSVWNKNKINLTQSFDFVFNVNLGCRDADGADGIVFILQTVSGSVGRNGSGMGFAGVTPSIGIALDTWQNIDVSATDNNLNDPAYDHISIQANGMVQHGNDLAGPVAASATSDNIEDCQWHLLRISWDAGTKWLRAYFDGVLRVEAQKDLVATIFNNDPEVYWGFSAATGGAVNVQQFCTALNPKFDISMPGDSICNTANVTFKDLSQSFAPIDQYFWSFGDGTTSTLPEPPHTYTKSGNYTVKMAITGKDGCHSDTLSQAVTIGSTPVAGFTISDTCFAKAPSIANISSNTFGAINKWNWSLNGRVVSADPVPVLNDIPEGTNQLLLQVTSEYGCASKPVSQSFTIKNAPHIEAIVQNGCVQDAVPFSMQQSDNRTHISQWHWDFGDNSTANVPQVQHQYSTTGNYTIQAWAEADNGCSSEVSTHVVSINKPYAFAGNDTTVLQNVPFSLNGLGSGSFVWSPSTGLDNNTVPNPVATLQNNQVYELTVTTAEGCVAKDSLHIEVFKGSAIYVPNAFTPDGNGLNDRLKPAYAGIKKLYYFTVYNRWGQKVFSTNNTRDGWDGKVGGKMPVTGTYVWLLKAEDIAGKVYQMKGTVTVIK